MDHFVVVQVVVQVVEMAAHNYLSVAEMEVYIGWNSGANYFASDGR